MSDVITDYLEIINDKFQTGQAREHAYRAALERLMESFPDINAINDPKRSEHGAPDFVFLKKSNPRIFQGYAEAKDVTANLDKVEKTNQMERYSGYDNLFLTDYLEFRFFRNGEKTTTVSLGTIRDGSLLLTPENGAELYRELAAFLERSPEQIRSGKRLAIIMGGYARRIRDNVTKFLTLETEKNASLEGMYAKMKDLLVHDLTPEKFADMYAQTLVYGLFVGRYNDTSLEDFTRQEAQTNIPRSNPFLRHFFDHIAGIEFDQRLAYIVDELCAVFAVSDVHTLIQKHLRLFEVENDRDPLIHFYEDFLKEYDPGLRKSMGAYYTPTPVVKFIIREVDRILKQDFGIRDGIASSEMFEREVETQPWRMPGERKDRLTKTEKIHRVQILDPAVGTATFLNETIKYIYEQKRATQAGQWPSYVREHLIPRLFGFELMMAPYTIAHLKLGMTLQETGVEDLGDERLNVYLTNTLEEGTPYQQRLELGLGQAIATESKLAADIKTTQPIMIVMGNPPYSGVSANETKFANSLIEKYKVEPGGQQRLQERKHWLNDDYVKFMAFAEDMIERNGSGIVAMITNNGYLDNPTFRGMRWHLTQTFDKIYVLDLHGNAKKKETAPDGSKDENVFNIMQGVGIVLAVKTGSNQNDLADIYHAEFYGKRKEKLAALAGSCSWKTVGVHNPMQNFTPQNDEGRLEYETQISINDLFKESVAGIVTARDKVVIDLSQDALVKRMERFTDLERTDDEIRQWLFPKKKSGKYAAGDTRGWKLHAARRKVGTNPHQNFCQKITYRPFDTRWIYYSPDMVDWGREAIMVHYIQHSNIGLCYERGGLVNKNPFFVTSNIIPNGLSFSNTASIVYTAPLYLFTDSSKLPNFNADTVTQFTARLEKASSAEEIFDYIYAILYSPSYREKYKEFLKTDFPRVPVPTQGEFHRLVPLGRRLRELHLMTSAESHEITTNYPVQGTNVVEKIVFQPEVKPPEEKDPSQTETGRVYINDTQYFDNVPRLAWEFYIGGYQPAQKWLKDRKGRTLTSDDLTHYQRIITILTRTHEIMQLIG
jgi:hypothetical protein